MSRRKADAVQDTFERYIALTAEQKNILAAQITGFNRGVLGGAVAGRNEVPDLIQQRRGRPSGSRNKPNANGEPAAEGVPT